VPSQKNYSLQTTVHVEGHPIVMEIDIGAAISIISEDSFTNSDFFKFLPLETTQASLHTCTGQSIEVQR